MPDIEDGVASFYENYTDKRCIEPSKPYITGRCHTTGNEMDELAIRVGFKTCAEFAAERKKIKSIVGKTHMVLKTMHWISLVLAKLLENESCDIIEILEEFCKSKVIHSNFEDASGFGFERIVFTYLDYLTWEKI